MEITGKEANVLLYGLDRMLATDSRGNVGAAYTGYSKEELQDLRDRLFAAHEHPEDE